MTAVREHPCGAWTYALTGPAGEQLLLDAAASQDGRWLVDYDGRTAYETPAWGHAEHSCVPAGQETLL